MKDMNLPRSLKIKVVDGKMVFYMIKSKLTIPLKNLEKQRVLTPSMVEYLRQYEGRLNKNLKGEITDVKTLARIKLILLKPQLEKDPIIDKDMKVETRYSETHYRKLGYKGYEDFQEKLAEARRLQEIEDAKKKLEEEKKNANTKK